MLSKIREELLEEIRKSKYNAKAEVLTDAYTIIGFAMELEEQEKKIPAIDALINSDLFTESEKETLKKHRDEVVKELN